MNTEEAIEILEQHQLWRKGLPPYEVGGECMPHTPKDLGLAIDAAIEYMKRGAPCCPPHPTHWIPTPKVKP